MLTGAQLRQVRPFFVVRTEHEFRSLLIVYSFILFAAVYAVHLAWRLVRFGGDLILLPLGHLLTGIGTLMMLSLRDPLRDRPLFPDFILGIALGCILLFFCSRPDYESTLLRRLAYIPLLASFGLSVMLVVFGSGPGVSDAKVNLTLGPFSTQPVELIKILLVTVPGRVFRAALGVFSGTPGTASQSARAGCGALMCRACNTPFRWLPEWRWLSGFSSCRKTSDRRWSSRCCS